jgi:serine/threonine protein kinase
LNDESGRSEPNDPRVEAALREFFKRVNRGEPVDREEFLARHAPIADQLRSTIIVEEKARKRDEAETSLDCAHDAPKSFAGRGRASIAPQSVGKQALKAQTGGTGLSGQFGRYRIIRALGKGGMGTVYLAVDTHIERQVALKTPHFTEDPTGEPTKRFFREARSAGNLRHPNICPIYDFGQIDGKHFITMAYIEGLPLSALIRADRSQSEREILIVIRKLALALEAAHNKGIVHRDLKPANIMVDTSGEPIIMDFGLARQISRGDDIRLTQTGRILGTPTYMSPEQVGGEPDKIGPAADQYSLGVILYELLTGELPFQGSALSVMGQIVIKEPPHPSQLRPEMDPRVETVCLTMMAKKPSERFASLQAVAEKLTNILDTPVSNAASQVRSGHHRARQIHEKYLGSGESDTARNSVSAPFRRLLKNGRWIPWGVLTLGLAVCGVVVAVVVSSSERTAVAVNDIKTRAPEVDKTQSPPLKPAQEEKTTAALPPSFTNNLGMEFVLVPKGKSWLGGGGGRTGEREVIIAHDFYLGKYEVTQEEWERVTRLTPSWFSRTGGGKRLVQNISDADLKRFPVENVSWDDVQAFLERLNNLEKVAGWAYRLPNTAEWEYACRGGPLSDKTESAYDFYFDKPTNQFLPQQMNAERRLARTCKVGSYQPDRLGFYDMHGNVWEWCNDPERTVNGALGREPRGGGWSTQAACCTAAFRFGPARWEGRVGLRLARSSGE